MFAKSLTFAALVFAGSTAPASGAIFQLNDNAPDGLFGNGETVTATSGTPAEYTVGTGTDALTISIEATSSVGTLTGNTLGEGGGGGGSGIGVDVNGPFSSNSPSQIEFASGGNPLGEGVLFSFKDSAGDPVAVNFIEATFASLGGSETVDITIGSYSESAGGNTDFGGTERLLAAGSQASFFAGTDTAFRIRSLEVEVVPEPASLMLVGAGLALMAGRRRA